MVLVLVSLIYFSGYEMIRRAMRLAYGGNPFEALEDMFAIAWEYALDFLAKPDVIIGLAIGSILAGTVVKAVSRIWS
ncbi:hypothetical protein AIOL_002054 [Candidatus Rhodobacter oscarellae]|uniref:Uncharacterized protein n=1 Tax=Candidatus Rhodobacter oscarellae TaxID=1675527 RepID=A0A0J9E2K9_9RHOB|nr:hypothetical protein AIOL_002054 [Candidatus Rhodobacter lobularis]